MSEPPNQDIFTDNLITKVLNELRGVNERIGPQDNTLKNSVYQYTQPNNDDNIKSIPVCCNGLNQADVFHLNNINNDKTNKSHIYNFYTDNTDKTDKTDKDDSRKLFLLNFEDDTFRAVIKIDNKYIEIINKWYSNCGQIMDLEETYLKVPIFITDNDISKILYRNINCKYKDLFINSYVPEILRNIDIQQRIASIESQMSIIDNTKINPTSMDNNARPITDLTKNIKIPTNLSYTEDYFYKKEKKLILVPKYKKKNKTNVEVNNNANVVDISGNTNFVCSSMLPDCEINKIKEKPNTDSGSFLFPLKSTHIPLRTLQKDINPNIKVDLNPKNECFKAYNYDYDCLKPPFGSNAMKLCSDFNDDTNANANVMLSKLIIVLINVFYQTMIIVDPDLLTLETIFECTEYGFTELFTVKVKNTDEEIEAFIKKQYDRVIFNNIEELTQALLSTSQFIEFIKNKQERSGPLVEEEKSVKEYLKNYFVISEDINKKMKASSLFDIVTKSDLCKIDKSKFQGFKNRLSNYLKEIGLQKKRYNDGYYYYGIIEKELTSYKSSRLYSSKILAIDDIIKEREMMNREITEPDFYNSSIQMSLP